jgi:hypothetical protein
MHDPPRIQNQKVSDYTIYCWLLGVGESAGSSSDTRPSAINSFSSSPDWCTIGRRIISGNNETMGNKLTAQNDITPAHKFPLDIDLGDRGPLAVFLDSLPQLLIRETIICHEFFPRDTLDVKDLADGTGETALRGVRGAFHEDHERVLLYGLRKERGGFKQWGGGRGLSTHIVDLLSAEVW